MILNKISGVQTIRFNFNCIDKTFSNSLRRSSGAAVDSTTLDCCESCLLVML